MKRAFTLVELLVVVTIIVLLLAMLSPAMSKAVYQGQIATCGARLKSVSGAVLIYAMDNRRYYPERGLRAIEPQSSVSWIAAYWIVLPDANYDMRKPLRPIMSVNKQLQCPLTEQLELEDTKIDENVASSYTPWWGWFWQQQGQAPLPGMFRMGDQFQSREGDRYNLLIGDYDASFGGFVNVSHPDREPARAYSLAVTYQSLFGIGAGPAQGYPVTGAQWSTLNAANDRGLVDLNHAYDDGSVRRYNDIRPWRQSEPRMNPVSIYYDFRRTDFFRIPAR